MPADEKKVAPASSKEADGGFPEINPEELKKQAQAAEGTDSKESSSGCSS